MSLQESYLTHQEENLKIIPFCQYCYATENFKMSTLLNIQFISFIKCTVVTEDVIRTANCRQEINTIWQAKKNGFQNICPVNCVVYRIDLMLFLQIIYSNIYNILLLFFMLYEAHLLQTPKKTWSDDCSSVSNFSLLKYLRSIC